MRLAAHGWLALPLMLLSASSALAEDADPPRIEHEPCAEYTRGDSLDIVARFYDASQIFDPKVIYRVGKSGAWRSQSFKRAGEAEDFKATISKRQLRGTLEYFIEVFDEHGNGPARLGAPEAPIEVRAVKGAAACEQVPSMAAAPAASAPSSSPPSSAPAPVRSEPVASPAEEITAMPERAAVAPAVDLALTRQPPPPAGDSCSVEGAPLYCSGWFWGAIAGVLVVGGGAAVYFLTRQPAESTGQVDIVVTGASPVD